MSMTPTLPRPDETAPIPARIPAPTPAPEPNPHRLRISATQLIASALAAVTATIAASYLGVNGTVIGAAVASVVSVLGNTIYSHSIRQTGHKVRTVVPAGVRWSPPPPPGASAAGTTPAGPPAVRRARREREKATSLRVLAAACAGVFAAVLVLVTAVELVAGEPLSDLLRGRSGSGTSLLGGHSEPRTQRTTPPQPAITPTVTVTAKVVTSTPTVTVTANPTTATVTPSPTAPTPTSPAPTPTPTSTGIPTPSGTPSP